MAGIGIKLNKIFNKNTMTARLFGFGYSIFVTIAPMLVIISAILIMQLTLGYSHIDYYSRELFSSTILYCFIFSMLASSPLNAVFSKYISDIIYDEKYGDILPCFYVGLGINAVVAAALGIPFCIREYYVGGIPMWYILLGYLGYMSMVILFFAMMFLSVCKDYARISLFFLVGMTTTVALSLILRYGFNVFPTTAMLIAMDVGIFVITCLEIGLLRSYFRENSRNYTVIFRYMWKYKSLVFTNTFYTLGLYIHNFVFWQTEMRTVIANVFYMMSSYDMATCIAMFTNISATVIFLSRVEMNFHSRYKAYSEAVIGGRRMDIENAKRLMFEQLTDEIMSLVRIQFIISTVLFLILETLMPRFGFGGMVLDIYPCLAAGYFITFIMYSTIIFLYYFNDTVGALFTSFSFLVVTCIVTEFATHLNTIWWGLGPVIGGLVAFSVGYFRIRSLEKNLDIHIFCNGFLLKRGTGKRPGNVPYERKELKKNKYAFAAAELPSGYESDQVYLDGNKYSSVFHAANSAVSEPKKRKRSKR